MATTPKILHSDGSSNVWTSEDRVVNFIWPDILSDGSNSIGPFTVEGEQLESSKKNPVKGKTEKIDPKDSILYYMRMEGDSNTASKEIVVDESTKVPVYYHTGSYDKSGIETLKPFRNVMFPRIWWDGGTRRVHMLYWSNIFTSPNKVYTTATTTEVRKDYPKALAYTKDANGNLIADATSSDTPIKMEKEGQLVPSQNDNVLCKFDGQRALFYTEGNEYLVNTNRTGTTKREIFWIFQLPVKVTTGGRKDSAIPEPILDVHPDPIAFACGDCCEKKKTSESATNNAPINVPVQIGQPLQPGNTSGSYGDRNKSVPLEPDLKNDSGMGKGALHTTPYENCESDIVQQLNPKIGPDNKPVSLLQVGSKVNTFKYITEGVSYVENRNVTTNQLLSKYATCTARKISGTDQIVGMYGGTYAGSNSILVGTDSSNDEYRGSVEFRTSELGRNNVPQTSFIMFHVKSISGSVGTLKLYKGESSNTSSLARLAFNLTSNQLIGTQDISKLTVESVFRIQVPGSALSCMSDARFFLMVENAPAGTMIELDQMVLYFNTCDCRFEVGYPGESNDLKKYTTGPALTAAYKILAYNHLKTLYDIAGQVLGLPRPKSSETFTGSGDLTPYYNAVVNVAPYFTESTTTTTLTEAWLLTTVGTTATAVVNDNTGRLLKQIIQLLGYKNVDCPNTGYSNIAWYYVGSSDPLLTMQDAINRTLWNDTSSPDTGGYAVQLLNNLGGLDCTPIASFQPSQITRGYTEYDTSPVSTDARYQVTGMKWAVNRVSNHSLRCPDVTISNCIQTSVRLTDFSTFDPDGPSRYAQGDTFGKLLGTFSWIGGTVNTQNLSISDADVPKGGGARLYLLECLTTDFGNVYTDPTGFHQVLSGEHNQGENRGVPAPSDFVLTAIVSVKYSAIESPNYSDVDSGALIPYGGGVS